MPLMPSKLLCRRVKSCGTKLERESGANRNTTIRNQVGDRQIDSNKRASWGHCASQCLRQQSEGGNSQRGVQK